MELSVLLNLVGSIASIGAIPLSIWLYLRAQEEKLASTRRDVLRILSYQLGEARPLTVFEIRAVIDSTLRAKRLKANSITPGQIIDDLVTETIANPMLAPDRKQVIITELERALLAPPLREILARHRIRGYELLALLRESGFPARAEIEVSPSDLELEAEAVAADAERATTPSFRSSKAFGIVSLFTTLFAVALQFGDLAPTIGDFLQRIPAQSLIVGVIVSGVAGLLSVLFQVLTSRTASRKRGGKAPPGQKDDELPRH